MNYKGSILPIATLRNIINKTYFDVNSDYLSNKDDLSEYDIQHLLFVSIKEQLKNKGCKIKKEKDRVDISIENEKQSFNYWFEIKSFIKPKEYIKIEAINSDINNLESLFFEKTSSEKRAFMVLIAREKTLQRTKMKNKDLSDYLNHKTKSSPLKLKRGFKQRLMTSYTISHNNSLERKNIQDQVRLFLIEISKTI
jgi:hypothetical protein